MVGSCSVSSAMDGQGNCVCVLVAARARVPVAGHCAPLVPFRSLILPIRFQWRCAALSVVLRLCSLSCVCVCLCSCLRARARRGVLRGVRARQVFDLAYSFSMAFSWPSSL